MKRVENPPGLDRIDYRLGTYGDFLDAMRERIPGIALPSGPNEDSRPLVALTTRSEADPSLAVLDAFAVVADVLTFYQERIANEGFLRTATERRSVLELADAIGYTLHPGVAATTNLVFTIADTPDAPDVVAIEPGLQVQSIPGPGEMPQLFETTEALDARSAWNAMRPRTRRPQAVGIGTAHLWLDGTGHRLSVGDTLLVIGDERDGVSDGNERWDFRVVQAVEPHATHGVTKVSLDRGLGWRRFGRSIAPASEDRRIYVFRGLTSLFGHNAPKWDTLPEATQDLFAADQSATPPDYPGWKLAENELALDPPCVDLEGKLEDVTEGSWIVLVSGEYAEVVQVEAISMGTRSDFLVTGPRTRITVDEGAENLDKMDRRDTVAHVDSDELPAGEEPITDAVEGDAVELDGVIGGLYAGRKLVFSGTTTDGDDASEVAVLDAVEVSDDGAATVLHLESPLEHRYDRLKVRVHGNVVAAGHGEAVASPLGSGDATAVFQRFALKKPPLTQETAATPSGVEPALEVRVDGVRWERLGTLHGQAPTTKGYVLRIDDDGVPTVTFGDGRSGARLPTGRENVVASYRTGLGEVGNVGASSLRLLKTKPLGVKSVDNPIEAKGGTDPESLDDARANAPLTVLTLDRLVSLTDFTDFARAFGGIAKALGTEIWAGEQRVVHVTVAAEGGATLARGDDLYDTLVDAIKTYKDPTQVVRVGSYEPRYFRIAADVLVDEDYLAEDVLAAVAAALRGAFRFDGRELGQAVSASDVIAVMQAVEGVVATDLNALYRTDEGEPDEDADEDELEDHLAMVLLAAPAALQADGTIRGAELLLVDEDDDEAVLLLEMPR